MADRPMRRAQDKAAGTPVLSSLAVTAGVLATALALTAGAVYWRQRDIQADAVSTFNRQVDRVKSDIERRFALPGYGLSGARGMYAAANASVGRSAFRIYVQSRDLPTEFRGVRGLGFAQKVLREDLDRFILAERRDQAPDFAVRTSGNARDLYVIKFIEPMADNRPAWGFDLGSEPVRRQAVDRAIASGDATLSDPITLLQDGKQGPGFIYLLPVYRDGATPSDIGQRNAALIGLLFSSIVASEILSGAADASAGELNFELYDGADVKLEKLVFVSQIEPLATPRLAAETNVGAPALVTLRSLEIGGRTLTLRARTTKLFDARRDHAAPALVGWGGTMLSLLLALAVWLLATGRTRAVRLANNMTADLERLAAVVRYTANTVVITDRDGRIVWINDGFVRTYGYTLEEAFGCTPSELVGSVQTSEATLEIVDRAFTSGESCQVEVHNKDKYGAEYWIALDIQPRHDAAGKLTGFMEIGSDITNRKRAEALLRVTNASLERGERISGIGGWEVDLVAQTLEWSDQTCRIYGVAPGFRPRMSDRSKFFAPAEKEIIDRTAKECIEGRQSWDIQLPATTNDGRSIWVRSIGSVQLENAVPVRVVGTLQDVTAQRAMQEELRRSNTVLQAILDNLPCGLSVFDGDLKLVAHNMQFRRLIDLPDTLFAAPATFFVDIIRYNAARGEYGPGDVEATVAGIVDRAAHPVAHQLERQRHDGVSIEVRGAPMPGGGFVSTYMDISERKKVERLKNEFISTVSHELRTPLTSIYGSLSLLASGQAGELPADVMTLIGIAHQSSERLIRLINDVLDVEKISSQMMTYRMLCQPLAPLIDQAIAATQAYAAQYNVEMVFDPREDTVQVEADSDRLVQVIVNLLSNAAKFSQGVASVFIRMTTIGSNVRVSVVDQGQGIPDEFRARIFERFSQADGSDRRQRGGTGLGLNICKSIVEAHHGRLDYISTVGSGSEFFFDLPLSTGVDSQGG